MIDYQPDNTRSNDPIVCKRMGYQQAGIFVDLKNGRMRIYIGGDHAGFDLKQQLVDYLKVGGHSVVDQGTYSADSVDYPDFAHAVAQQVAGNEGSLGVVICGSGNGVNITANKHNGVRSALAWAPEIAALARQHNDANVLALPARYISVTDAKAIIDAFLGAGFEGGRHQARVEKIEKGC
jgi:ribose 5-phosphate isomerase B